jgi:hypothetical protein
MSEALVPAKNEAVAATTVQRYSRPLIYQEALIEEGQQRKLLMSYVKAHMIEGVDYGVIPGTKNKTLLKPGAEKLTDLFRCAPEFEIMERVEDFDRPLFHYVFRCRIVSRETGGVVAEGFGSCNSREGRYRWRNGERTCPMCGKATIINGKAEYGGGYICFAKKGGCGAKFNKGDKQIEGQVIGKIENPDVADCANTILKMSKKRAQVDAVIALARCSDMFTQDAEDFADAEVVQHEEPRPTQRNSTPPAPQSHQPHPDEIDAVADEPAQFKAALAKSLFQWPGLIQAINRQFSTQYTTKTTFDEIDREHRAWAANVLLTTPNPNPQAK